MDPTEGLYVKRIQAEEVTAYLHNIASITLQGLDFARGCRCADGQQRLTSPTAVLMPRSSKLSFHDADAGKANTYELLPACPGMPKPHSSNLPHLTHLQLFLNQILTSSELAYMSSQRQCQSQSFFHPHTQGLEAMPQICRNPFHQIKCLLAAAAVYISSTRSCQRCIGSAIKGPDA